MSVRERSFELGPGYKLDMDIIPVVYATTEAFDNLSQKQRRCATLNETDSSNGALFKFIL